MLLISIFLAKKKEYLLSYRRSRRFTYTNNLVYEYNVSFRLYMGKVSMEREQGI
jgi:hypothetical protein